MPIIDIQQRMHQRGRIRIGHKVTAKSGKQRPEKLDRFRFTAKDEAPLEAIAAQYGGNVQPFKEDLSDDRFQVTTETNVIDIVIPPGDAGFSQWLELWSKGGNQRRCDGEWEVNSDGPCICKQENPDEIACDYKTRVSVMLRDVPGLGLWRLDTGSWYAAQELAGVANLCRLATERGQLLPAKMRLEPRSYKRKDKDGKPITLRTFVAVIDIDQTPGQLVEALTAGQPVALEGRGAAALEAGPSFTPVAEPEPVDVPSVAAQVKAVEEPSEKPKRRNAQAPLPGSGRSRIKDSGGAGAGEHGEHAATGDDGGDGSEEPGPSGSSLTVAQRLAMKAEDEGIDDETRHVLVSMLTGGRTESGKDVTEEEASALFELYHTFGQGGLELRLHAERSEWFLDDGNGKALVPAVEGGRLALKVPPRLQLEGASDGGSGTVDSGSAVPDPAALRERAKSLGVNGNKLLGKANRLARERDEGAVQTLDDLESASAGLLAELGDWVEEEAGTS